ncbi:MAG: hypothetical protein GY754_23250 [bacterium]|nr:hypothetical protein [bacterium]
MKKLRSYIYKNLLFSRIIILLMILVSGCELASDSEPISGPDQATGKYINIFSVAPSSDLIDGENTVIEVVVDYSLTSLQEAELNIGFNTTNPYRCDFIPGEKQIIDRGNGSHTFTVSVPVKDWKQFGDFKVFVYLVENLAPAPFRPLAHDSQILTF